MLGEAREQVGAVGHLEPAARREPARHGEVIVGHHRLQAARVARLEHAAVMVELGGRELPWLGLDPRPFDPEAVAVEAEVRGDRDVLGIAVVAVAGVARRLAVQRRR